jgi:hypothetical protein
MVMVGRAAEDVVLPVLPPLLLPPLAPLLVAETAVLPTASSRVRASRMPMLSSRPPCWLAWWLACCAARRPVRVERQLAGVRAARREWECTRR